jgi:hypothetical protein
VSGALLHQDVAEQARPSRRRAYVRQLLELRIVVVALALFAWGLSISIADDFGLTDESWFLRVSQRVVQGDVLYRDIFYGTTPFSVYISAVAVRLFGVEIVVIKALVTLCFVASVLLTWQILRQLGASRVAAGLAGFTLLAYASPEQAGVYNPLSNVWLLGTFSATLAWLRARASGTPPTRWLAIAGVIAGLCFATKQNIGLYAVAALVATITLATLREPSPWQRIVRDGATALGWFLVCTVVIHLPILLSGGWAQFIDYGFTNKRTYLQVGDISYMEGIRRIGILWRNLRVPTFQRAREFHNHLIYLLPLLFIPGLMIAALGRMRQRHADDGSARVGQIGDADRSGAWPAEGREDLRTTLRNRRAQGWAVAGFVGASLAGIYPRFDYSHVVYAIPAALIGLVWVWQHCRICRLRSVRMVLGGLVLLWSGGGMLALSIPAFSQISSPDYQWSTIPHFQGVRINRDEHSKLMQATDRIRAIGDSDPVFLLTPYASFFYLAAEIDNRTAFDYPLVTAFGRSGMNEVQRELEEGRIRRVCMTLRPWSRLRPAMLEEYILEHFRRGENLQWCQLYQAHSRALRR